MTIKLGLLLMWISTADGVPENCTPMSDGETCYGVEMIERSLCIAAAESTKAGHPFLIDTEARQGLKVVEALCVCGDDQASCEDRR